MFFMSGSQGPVILLGNWEAVGAPSFILWLTGVSIGKQLTVLIKVQII
jgi:hypothetical protein